MNTTEIRRGLERTELSSYQAKVYTTLLEHGSLSAVEVARRSSVPGSRIYDVLTDLEHEGYVETFEREDKRHARVTEPSGVVDRLRHESEQLSATAESIEDAWEQTAVADHRLMLFEEVDPVLDQVESLVREAETSVAVAATLPQYYRLREALSTGRENGAVVHVSLEGLDRMDIDSEQPVTELRHRPIPGPFIAVVDRTHTCFAPNERAAESYGIAVNDSILSLVFHWYFQTCLWSVCERVYRRHEAEMRYVSTEAFVRDVYPLWCSGAVLPVTVRGTDLETGEERTESGVLTDIQFPGRDVHDDGVPSYGELAGVLTLVVENEAGRHRIGGWGAVWEDMEAEQIVVHGSAAVIPPGPPVEQPTSTDEAE